MRVVKLVLSLVTMLTLLSTMSLAQTSSTARLSGDVLDESGAVVSGADVTLTDSTTNTAQKTTTNEAGHYTFPAVQPGQYRLAISKAGFRQTVIDLTLRVGVATAQNVTLQVGTANQTIEVRATGAELQTEDASVGNVLTQQTLQSLPSLSRDVTALLQLQPMAAPSYNSAPGANNGEGDTTSGGVAGALNDQNTFSLDGGDATSNTEGDSGYANTFQGTPRAAVPTPVESIEEFRVTTNNSNTFARSSGADVQIATRRGSNSWHGSGWEYNQNTDYNGNLWQLNNEGKPRPVWQDNRFGGKVGGPIIRDKAFFFLLYEGRHFQKATPFTRLVPSDLMKAGVLQFRDATGAVISYNFAQGAPTAMCAGGPCDPRGKGISPIISQMWNSFEPRGNNLGEGDGLNTIGFDGAVPVLDHEHDGVARFDYNLSPNWTVNAVGRYAVDDAFRDSQIDIGGITAIPSRRSRSELPL